MSPLLAQGLELMVYGMGTVVSFLALLVIATRLMSGMIRRYFPGIEPPAGAMSGAQRALHPAVSSPTEGPDPRVLAAVVAAVHLHRKRL